MWVYFWAICSVPSAWISVLVPVPHCLGSQSLVVLSCVKCCAIPSFVLFFPSRLFWLYWVWGGFHVDFLAYFLQFCDGRDWNLVCIKSVSLNFPHPQLFEHREAEPAYMQGQPNSYFLSSAVCCRSVCCEYVLL